MTDTEYFAHPAISREDLLLLADSPELFHAAQSGGVDADELQKVRDELDPPSRKLDLFGIGEATHRLIFEPDTVAARFCPIPANVLAVNGARSGNAWKAFKAQCDQTGTLPLKDGQLALASMVSSSAKRTLGPLLVSDAVREKPIFWKEYVEVEAAMYEVECRCKPDYLFVRPEQQLGIIIDLKTCADVADFRFNIGRFRYWMQCAHYRAAFKATYGFLPRFYFAAVQKKPPFRCRLVQLDDETEHNADVRRQELLQEYVRRRETNDWTDPEQTGIETVAVQIT